MGYLHLQLLCIEDILRKRILVWQCCIRLSMTIFLLEAVYLGFGSHEVHQIFLCSSNDPLCCSFIQIAQFLAFKGKVGLNILVEVWLEAGEDSLLLLLMLLAPAKRNWFSITIRSHLIIPSRLKTNRVRDGRVKSQMPKYNYLFITQINRIIIAILHIFKMNNFGFPQSTTYANSQVTSHHDSNYTAIENGGLFTRDQCRNLARKIIETYDGNGDGVCQTIEVAKWLVDCYRAMNKSFQPTATDIASYVQIIDKNRNGKVTRQDLQEFIIRYFFNPNRVA